MLILTEAVQRKCINRRDYFLLICSVQLYHLRLPRERNVPWRWAFGRTLGSGRRLLIAQFLSESAFFRFLQMRRAYFSRTVAALVQISSNLSMKWTTFFRCPILPLCCRVGVVKNWLVAGLYPAFFKSSSIRLCHEGKVASGSRGEWCGRYLIMSQFFISTA